MSFMFIEEICSWMAQAVHDEEQQEHQQVYQTRLCYAKGHLERTHQLQQRQRYHRKSGEMYFFIILFKSE